MKDADKTKEQLITELVKLRRRVRELETSETERKQAEEALRESEERYRWLVSNIPDVVWTEDENDSIVFISPNIEKLTGYTQEETYQLGNWMKWFDRFLHPDDIEHAKTVSKEAYKEGKPFDIEYRFKRKDGQWIWISDRSVGTYEKDGKLYADGLSTDITERKEAEEALRESEERYRSLVDLGGAVGEAIIRTQDTEQGDAIQTFVSNEWPRITGYSKKELLGMSFFDLLHPKYREASLKRHKRKAGGEAIPQLFEMSIVRKDGTEVPIELTSAYSTYKGKPANVAFIRDITERKEAEEALRESEERYRSLVDLGGAVGEAAIMLQDTEQGDAIQTFVSKEWPHITGYSKKELLGMSFFDLVHPRYHEAALKRHKRRMRGEAIPKLFELSIVRKGGTEVPIEITSAYSTYKGERANVVFIRDITERKQAEERERQLQQELYLSSRLAAIGELAAGVAHEINNPLTGILGYSELLLRKPTDENTRKGLEIIHNSSLRVAKIVQNLLTFARHRQPKKEYVDINEIVKEALELRAYELKTSNIEVALDLAPDLPQIMGDFHQTQEVFLNLILNAEQAMTEAHRGGKLIIKTKQLKDRVRVSFTDDGPGIPAEHLNKLFDPFFSTRGEKGGTGLGLSICHGIVEEHRGRIYAKSKMGEGATLFVELPVTT